MDFELQHLDTFVMWSERELTFGNRCFRRRVDLSAGYPRTVSLVAGEREYASPDKQSPDCSFIGINRPGYHRTDYRIINLTAEWCCPEFESAHLHITLRFGDLVQRAEFRREFFVYPETVAHAVRNSISSEVLPNLYWNCRSSLCGPGNTTRDAVEHLESTGESLALAPGYEPVLAVEFAGRTDYTDQLVTEHPLAGGSGTSCGNVLECRDAAGTGFLLLQEAAPSAERRDFESYDFRWTQDEVFSCTWGAHPSELVPGEELTGCRHVFIPFVDAGTRFRHRNDYLAKRFPVRPEELRITVNPWGCGCFPKLTSENFLLDEISASARIGADLYQIDDSWQTGTSLMELMHNAKITPEFWTVSAARLGGGFERLAERAATDGVKLALWCAPSANVGYRDWRTLADQLLDYHRWYGFAAIKIDGVQVRTLAAQNNLESLLRFLRHETGGAIQFNLDTTNGQRPGYFQLLEYGNIFLENRYAGLVETIGYHPEKTLRSFHRLAGYVRAQSLQVEVPSPDDINPALYRKIGMALPDCYPAEYWYAIALFANVLLWFAPSRLSPGCAAAFARMNEVYHRIRERLWQGRVIPVGADPDGGAITGFFADSGLLLVFREVECRETSVLLNVPGFPAVPGRWRRIAGDPAAVATGFRVTLPNRASFALWELVEEGD